MAALQSENEMVSIEASRPCCHADAVDFDFKTWDENVDKMEDIACEPLNWLPTIGISLYTLAALLYLVRTFSVMMYADIGEALIRLAAASTYLIIGVVLPLRAHKLKSSAPFRCIEGWRINLEKRSNDGEDKEMCYRLECVRVPITVSCTLLALACPIRVCVIMVLKYKSFSLESLAMLTQRGYRYLVVAISLFGVVGKLFLDTAGVRVLHASKRVVQGLIVNINDDKKLIHEIWEMHHNIDKAIDRVWQVQSAGFLWFARACLLFLISFGFLIELSSVYNAKTFNSIRFWVLFGGALLCSLCGLRVITHMTSITTLCQERKAGCDSVVNAVHDRMKRELMKRAMREIPEASGASASDQALTTQSKTKREASQDIAHLAYANYVMTSSMGTHVMGMTMTNKTVLHLFTFSTFLPHLLVFLSRHLHSSRGGALQA